ncbi:hypothetical protein [Pedobacter sp. Leaf132]|uniref:hypothetical protein n=1 Tax=Pedobacter sp. Leaf132 TaxID=2876557 RepID=UPI001E54C9B1|nr:hypothetical protein [Pedobacter sp. Leaf132]
MIFAFIAPKFSQAQNLQGCGKVGGSQIYYMRNGFGSGLNFLIPRYDAPFSTFTSSTTVCPRFTTYSLASPQTACCIGATDCSNNYIYNFTNIGCDLDDYTPALLASIGLVGILVIRKRKKQKSPQ